MFKIENLYLKNALFTIGFYFLLLIASYFLDIFYPSGPCTLGLGAAIFGFAIYFWIDVDDK